MRTRIRELQDVPAGGHDDSEADLMRWRMGASRGLGAGCQSLRPVASVRAPRHFPRSLFFASFAGAIRLAVVVTARRDVLQFTNAGAHPG